MRKCGELRAENAHEAYVTREEFERVQRLVEGRNRPGNPFSPARRRADKPFLLSGLLPCGYCNSTLVGGNNGRYQFYRCDGRPRRSLDCVQRYMVAHRLHEVLSGWVMDHVLVPDLMRAHRDRLANTQAISREVIEQRLRLAEQQRKILQQSIERLLDAIESGAREAVERLAARRVELARVEQEESDLRGTLALEKLTIEDEAIERLCDYMREKLVSGKPEPARRVLRDCISEARLFNDRVELMYLPLPLGVFHPMPPRGFFPSPIIPVLAFDLPIQRAKRGAGSPLYVRG